VREKINILSGTTDIIVLMSEGNPGAVSVMMKIRDADTLHNDAWLLRIFDLDDMNMRGPQIWLGYKDHCKEDIEVFIQCIKDRDADMVRAVNNEMSRTAEYEKAVTYGGSNR